MDAWLNCYSTLCCALPGLFLSRISSMVGRPPPRLSLCSNIKMTDSTVFSGTWKRANSTKRSNRSHVFEPPNCRLHVTCTMPTRCSRLKPLSEKERISGRNSFLSSVTVALLSLLSSSCSCTCLHPQLTIPGTLPTPISTPSSTTPPPPPHLLSLFPPPPRFILSLYLSKMHSNS